MIRSVPITAVLFVAAMSTTACKTRGPRSPEKLRDAHVAALEADDPERAYALLSPQVQAQVPYVEFEKRWKANALERKATANAASKLSSGMKTPVYEGTTAHEGGRVLRWTSASGEYYVIDGLPGVPQTQTPAQTVRALIEAVRSTDVSRVRALLSDELATAITDDWRTRVEAIEAALERPGAIELSPDLRRAELRYEPNRTLTMEQTPTGWRITSLE